MTRSKLCSRKTASRLNWLAVSALLILSDLSVAAVYEYRDLSGRRVFVDRLSKVPVEYRDQLQIREALEMTAEETAQSQRLQQIAQLERALRNIDKLLGQQTSAISTQNNQILVPVRVARGNRSQQLRLLLDTGANRTVFHRDALSQLGSVGEPVGEAQIASGQKISLYAMNLDSLDIGPFEIAPVQVQVIDYQGIAAHQGLLGMDLLSQIQYEIDVSAQVLRWAPEQFNKLETQRSELETALEELRSPPLEQLEKVQVETLADDKAE